jgi:fatty acid desaturase
MDKSVIRPFLQKSNVSAMLAISRDWLVIAVLVYLNIRVQSIWLYLPSVWLIGLFQFAIGEALLHEAAHGNLFTNKRLHNRLQFFYGLPFFKTVKQYRLEHQQHHNQLGKAGDKVIADYRNFGFFLPGQILWWLVWVKPLAGFAGYYYVKQLKFGPWRDGLKVGFFWLAILLGFSLKSWLLFLLLYWLVPFFWCFHCFLYWSEISDHLLTRTGTRSNTGRLINFLTHNNGFHDLHHRYPTIPWFNLRKAYSELPLPDSETSGGLFDTYRQFRSFS